MFLSMPEPFEIEYETRRWNNRTGQFQMTNRLKPKTQFSKFSPAIRLVEPISWNAKENMCVFASLSHSHIRSQLIGMHMELLMLRLQLNPTTKVDIPKPRGCLQNCPLIKIIGYTLPILNNNNKNTQYTPHTYLP